MKPLRAMNYSLLASFLVIALASCGGGSGSGSTQPDTGNSLQTFSATVSWTIPDSRENGEVLEIFEIGGYEIQYRLSNDPAYTSIIINNGSADSHQITNLAAGTYEFRMASFDSSNVFSSFTAPVSADLGS